MDEDKFALVEKIIKDIDNVMTKNAELSSFDIVPVETNYRNKSPVLYLESCLGLESWCVKHVYMYCYSEIMDKYFSNPKRKAVKVSMLASERLTRLLNTALLLNPELTSMWNKRRDMVTKSLLNEKHEIQFTKLVLSRKPKCNDAFAYRRWLLDRLFLEDEIISSLEQVINEELNVCDLASEKSPNNYHSWNHRMWFVKKLKTMEKHFGLHYLYINEYEHSRRWTEKHVSDYSCFHYLQYCIHNMLTINNEKWKFFQRNSDWNLRKQFVRVLTTNYPTDKIIQDNLVSYTEDKLVSLILGESVNSCSCVTDQVSVCRQLEVFFQELVVNNEMIMFYKHHETLWYHRRWIVRNILEIMYEYFGLTRQSGLLVKTMCKKCNSSELSYKNAKISRYDSNQVYFCILFNVIMSHENKFIADRRSDNDKFADRHEKYLKIVEQLENVM